MTNTLKPLAKALMHAAGLDLNQIRRLVWGWQSLADPQGERIASDALARLFDGLPVTDRDEMFAHAALISVLPAVVDGSAQRWKPFGNDKVLDILARSGSAGAMSPWRFARVWADENIADLAQELGLERRTLRRLDECHWGGAADSGPLVEALADLGMWFGANAISLGEIPCEAA